MQLHEIPVRVCRCKPAAHFYSRACSYSLLQSLPTPASTTSALPGLLGIALSNSPLPMPTSALPSLGHSLVISLSLVPDHLREGKMNGML